MTTDAAELLFERYLAEHGYEVLSYEVDLGTRKRPDYLIGERNILGEASCERG